MEMSKDCRSLKTFLPLTGLNRHQTMDWFNKNRIVIKAAYRSVSDEIKEKCEQSNMLYYYVHSHCIHCIHGEDEYIGKAGVSTDEYKIEINQTGLKVKELAKWALNKFNTETRVVVWIELQPLPVNWFTRDTYSVLVDGVATLKVNVQKDPVDTDNQEQ